MTTELKQPLLNRLVLTTLNREHEAHNDHVAVPVIGATVEVTDIKGNARTISLTGNCWDAIARLIHQTPDEHRPGLAELFRVIESNLDLEEPIGWLLAEVIREVEHEPYTGLKQTPPGAYAYAW